MKNFLNEFKAFAMKGNMIDMAMGIVIGGAFGTIVKSMVDDVLMPIVGYFGSGTDFTNNFITLSDGSFETLAQAKEAGAATINYGLFINAFISFVIVAFVLFMIIKAMNKMKKKEEAAPSAPPKQEVLLEEIRDLLKK